MLTQGLWEKTCLQQPSWGQAQGTWGTAKEPSSMPESLGSGFSRGGKSQRQLGWGLLPKQLWEYSHLEEELLAKGWPPLSCPILKVEAPGSKVLLTPKYLTWCYIFNKLLGDGKQFCSCVIQQEESSRLLGT